MKAFKQFDKDGDGTVTHQEFLDIVRDMNIPYTKKDGEKLLNWVDLDGDGNIGYNELATMLFTDVRFISTSFIRVYY